MTLDNNINTTLGDSYIHDPSKNGLHYLHQYTYEQANMMLTAKDHWTRAILTRNPKERVLSAYLDKGVRHNASYIQRHCGYTIHSFQEFVNTTIEQCRDAHWMPQAYRMEREYWPYVNFVGHLETAAHDMKVLLQHLGVYEQYGWGPHGNASMFEIPKSVKHATGANALLKKYYTPTLELQVEQVYRVDYEHKVLNLTMTKINWDYNSTAVA